MGALAVQIFMVMRMGYSETGEYDWTRNLIYSNKGTYGSAGSMTKRGSAEVLAGRQMYYDPAVANTSNVPLNNDYWHERISTDVARATVFTTGTYSVRLNYHILYKTNYFGIYQVLVSNLNTRNSYSFSLNAIPMQTGEYVTDVYDVCAATTMSVGTAPAIPTGGRVRTSRPGHMW